MNVHIVNVGMNPLSEQISPAFHPTKISAEPGDVVQFHFLAGAHTVTQSNFDNPCIPVGNVNASAQGIYSGAMDTAASKADGMAPIFSVMIKDTRPMWLYCTTGQHCKGGMAMVINENPTANASRTLDNYVAAAANFAGVSPQPGAGLGDQPSSENPGGPSSPSSPSGLTTSALPGPSDGADSPSEGDVAAAGSGLSFSLSFVAAAAGLALLLA